jgi:hypothetical protein
LRTKLPSEIIYLCSKTKISNMALELTGRVRNFLKEQTGSGRNGNWVKQEVIIETNDQYPKTVCCSAWGDKVDELRRLSPGDEVKLSINIESREYNERWYTDVRIWKIEPIGQSSGGGKGSAGGYNEYDSSGFSSDPGPSNEDDLPF